MSALPLAMLSCELVPLPDALQNLAFDIYASLWKGSLTFVPKGLDAHDEKNKMQKTIRVCLIAFISFVCYWPTKNTKIVPVWLFCFIRHRFETCKHARITFTFAGLSLWRSPVGWSSTVIRRYSL